jgi:two-component system, cell cycle sensor histidine kinase and response regulator CckA
MTESTKPRFDPAKTILVAEDEPLIRECIVGPLRRVGYQVLAATDGVDGAVLFARNYETIVLLMTDISMPGMLGTDLAKFARKIRPDINVVFASGSILQIDPHPSSFIEGAVILNKPFTVEELLKTVADIVGPPLGPPTRAPMANAAII